MDIGTGGGWLKAEGFVFGKFYPLHCGHLAMIRFAAEKVRRLFVIVCVSDYEIIPLATRIQWLQDELADNSKIFVIGYQYQESQLPNTSVSDVNVSAIWAKVFKQLVPNVEVLVTSEDYGQYVAEAMGISHIPFDPDRKLFPVSASVVREDILQSWNYLPAAVQASLQKVIMISGTESTGKTTLARYLFDRFPSSLVEEAARELIPTSKKFELDDLYNVALSQAHSIGLAKKERRPFVFVDTDVYLTQSYAEFIFKQQLDLQSHIYHLNQADLRLYLDASVPHIQDGTRLDEQTRNQLDISHRETLDKYCQPYSEVIGTDWGDRNQQAMKNVTGLMVMQWRK
jgi:HTH-type transcriptional repressor of NAD biosynthesis genes